MANNENNVSWLHPFPYTIMADTKIPLFLKEFFDIEWRVATSTLHFFPFLIPLHNTFLQ